MFTENTIQDFIINEYLGTININISCINMRNEVTLNLGTCFESIDKYILYTVWIKHKLVLLYYAIFHCGEYKIISRRVTNMAENIKEMNRENSELASVTSWAAWFEGEESWGANDDD